MVDIDRRRPTTTNNKAENNQSYGKQKTKQNNIKYYYAML